MKSKFAFGALGAAALAFSAFGQSDPTIFDNGSPTLNSGFATQRDTVYPFLAMVADDFSFTSGQLVTGFTFQGQFFNGAAISGFDLEVHIYADAGGEPTGAGLPDPSVTALLSQTLTAGQYTQTDTGDGINFNFAGDLAVPFAAAPGTTFWVSFVPVFAFPPQLGWNASSTGGGGNPAVSGFDFLGQPFWDGAVPSDRGFTLTGVVPAPGALALLGLAGLAARRRRRA